MSSHERTLCYALTTADCEAIDYAGREDYQVPRENGATLRKPSYESNWQLIFTEDFIYSVLVFSALRTC